MTATKKNRILLFLLGLSSGLLMATVALYVSEKNSSTISEGLIDKIVSKVLKAVTIAPKNIENKTTINHIYQRNEKEQKPTKNSLSIDSKNTSSVVDSSQVTATEELIVTKDVMVAMQVIQIENRNLVDKKKQEADSIVQSLADVEQPKQETIEIEYWLSPINYKGYKLNKNKLLVFGIPETTDAKIIQLTDCLVLKHKQYFYKLYYGDDFRTLEPLNDTEIISKELK